jgi:hypothetical protein
MSDMSKQSGWTTFSWIIFMLAGFANMLYGGAALVRKEYFPEAGIIFQSLQSHGWVWLMLGILQVLVAVAIAYRMSLGRVVGLLLAVVGAAVWFFYMLYLPNGGLGMVILYVLVIYGLAAHPEGFAA